MRATEVSTRDSPAEDEHGLEAEVPIYWKKPSLMMIFWVCAPLVPADYLQIFKFQKPINFLLLRIIWVCSIVSTYSWESID